SCPSWPCGCSPQFRTPPRRYPGDAIAGMAVYGSFCRRPAERSLLQLIALELSPERGFVDAKDLGGEGAIAVRLAQGLADEERLDLVETLRRNLVEGLHRHLPRSGQLRRQDLAVDAVGFAQNGHALEQVLQLADIA